MSDDCEVVIAGAARTPMGGLQGCFGGLSAPHLGAVAIEAALRRGGVAAAEIDQVIMGCVLGAGQGQAPARQAALHAGLEVTTPCVTINKMCGSGMKAVMDGCDQIRARSSDAVIAGGMENMSLAPYLLPKARAGLRMGHGQLVDSMFCDGLEDAYEGGLMGEYAQASAERHQMSREAMDDFAIHSLEKALQAQRSGWFEDEIATVEVSGRRAVTTIAEDEQPAKANIDKIRALRPAFKEGGTLTAANSSSISDGAAALLLMRHSQARALGAPILCRIVAHASYAAKPADFVTAPIGAVERLLKRTGWACADVDLWEINEAFAAVTMLAVEALGIEAHKVNVHGGACALGHPIGCSGARIIVTLIHALQRTGGRRGIATLCIGGGEATAIAIERV
ncbi:MAG: thiolase family protein [Pseudomonadales bacterium]